MTTNRPIIKPITSPRAGQPIRESFVQELSLGVNRLGVRRDSPASGIRWAVTASSEKFPYPAKSESPAAFPFQWVYAMPIDSTQNQHPIRPGGRSNHWRPTSAGQIDGMAFCMPSTSWYTDTSATEGDFTQDYVPEHTLIMVSYGHGAYHIVRPDVGNLLFVAAERIAAAEINSSDPESWVFHAGDCHVHYLHQTSVKTFGVRQQHFRLPESTEAGSPRVVEVANPDPHAAIEAGTVFWGEVWAGGVWVASFIPCSA
jgi:hypothetical protein